MLVGCDDSSDISVEKEIDPMNNPPEEYIIDCLETIPCVVEIEVATYSNDPNGKLNEEGGYTSAVFFAVDLIDQSEFDEVSVLDRGTDCGGCVEVYSTEEDAIERDEYLSKFDGLLFLDSGSHIVLGTSVIRTSSKLDEDEQSELENQIIAAILKEEKAVEESEDDETQAQVPYGSFECDGMHFEDIIESFEDAGFSNITTEILYDIVFGWTEEGEVESVSIDGYEDFEKDDTFNKDAVIVITYHMWEDDDPNKQEEITDEEESEESRAVFYSTNDYETAKKGNTGIFSYVDNGNSYDIYWIIDFDEGYVYYFTDGNGETFCDRLEIESGDLNTYVKITYHDAGTQWSYKLHFKYENHPETLIMVDQNGFDWKYSTTDLDDALAIRDTKKIKDY